MRTAKHLHKKEAPETKTNFGYGKFRCYVIRPTVLQKGGRYDTEYDFLVSGRVVRSKKSFDRMEILSVSSKAGSERRYQLDARTFILEGCTGRCRLLLSFFLRRYIVRHLGLGIANSEMQLIYSPPDTIK